VKHTTKGEHAQSQRRTIKEGQESAKDGLTPTRPLRYVKRTPKEEHPLKRQIDKIIKEIDKFIKMAKNPKPKKPVKAVKRPIVKPFGGIKDPVDNDGDNDGGIPDNPTHPDA
jgi:hypothetical protein